MSDLTLRPPQLIIEVGVKSFFLYLAGFSSRIGSPDRKYSIFDGDCKSANLVDITCCKKRNYDFQLMLLEHLDVKQGSVLKDLQDTLGHLRKTPIVIT